MPRKRRSWPRGAPHSTTRTVPSRCAPSPRCKTTSPMEQRDLHEHLFRHEAGRMTASLTRLFGVHNLALAEDVVQDAFARALEVWKLQGPPPNPSAWLMTTARNMALDVIRRERTARAFAPELTRLLETEWAAVAVVD